MKKRYATASDNLLRKINNLYEKYIKKLTQKFSNTYS